MNKNFHQLVLYPFRLKITTVTFLLFCFSNCNNLYAQESKSHETKVKMDTLWIDDQLIESRKLWEETSFDAARKLALSALEQSRKLHYYKGELTALKELGNIYGEEGKLFESMNYYKETLKRGMELRNKLAQASGLTGIGLTYEGLGEFGEAIIYHLKAYKISEGLSDIRIRINVLSNLGMAYSRIHNYEKALKYTGEALSLVSNADMKEMTGMMLHNRGVIFAEMRNFTEAIKCNTEALEIYKESGDEIGQAYSMDLLGGVYLFKNNFDEAEGVYLKAIEIYRKFDYINGIVGIANNLSKVYRAKKQLKKSREYANLSLNLAMTIGDKKELAISFGQLAYIDSAEGNFKDALKNHKQYDIYSDSINWEKNANQIKQMELQSDFDKKESEMIAAQTKKEIINKKAFEKQKLIRNGWMTGSLSLLIFSIVVYRQRNKIKRAKQRSDELLLNILPAEVAEELKEKGSAEAKMFNEVTVMFTDFKDFTQISEKLTPSELIAEIDSYFKAFDEIITKHNIEKIKTIGDSYMCAGGLPVTNKTNAVDVINAAMEIQKFMIKHREENAKEGKSIFEIRIGIHTGPVVAGIVGLKKFAYDIWGDTVNIASRMESSCLPGKINISEFTHALVKDQFKCISRGEIEAKHKGKIEMFFVEYS